MITITKIHVTALSPPGAKPDYYVEDPSAPPPENRRYYSSAQGAIEILNHRYPNGWTAEWTEEKGPS
jgi:hypothetical protein